MILRKKFCPVYPLETRYRYKAPDDSTSGSLGVPGTSGRPHLQDTRVEGWTAPWRGDTRTQAPLGGHACPGWSQAPRQLKNFEAVSVDDPAAVLGIIKDIMKKKDKSSQLCCARKNQTQAWLLQFESFVITSTGKVKAGLPEEGEGHGGRIVYVTQMCDVRLN